MRLAHAVRVFGVILLVSGTLALFMPKAVADFVGLQIEAGSANGAVEIAAVYGGVPIALGAIMVYASVSLSAAAAPALATVGWIFASAAVARVFSAFVIGPQSLGVMGWMLLGFDVATAAVALLGSRALELPTP